MPKNYRTVFGLLLILSGSLLMLQRLGIIGGRGEDAVFTVIYGISFLYFASMYQGDRSRWWAALVAFIMLGGALGNLFEIFLPGRGGQYTGSLVLFLIGLGFLTVYLSNRMLWWAIIPSGALFSLSTLTLVDELPNQLAFESAGILFIGLGLTFLVLYFLRVDGPRLLWAIYPAAALFIFGLFIGFEEGQLWDYIWPSLIVILGIYFVVGSLRRAQDA